MVSLSRTGDGSAYISSGEGAYVRKFVTASRQIRRRRGPETSRVCSNVYGWRLFCFQAWQRHGFNQLGGSTFTWLVRLLTKSGFATALFDFRPHEALLLHILTYLKRS